jgi:hypothetical protein
VNHEVDGEDPKTPCDTPACLKEMPKINGVASALIALVCEAARGEEWEYVIALAEGALKRKRAAVPISLDDARAKRGGK